MVTVLNVFVVCMEGAHVFTKYIKANILPGMSAADMDDSLNLSSFSSLFLDFISRLLAQQPKKEGDVVVGVHEVN